MDDNKPSFLAAAKKFMNDQYLQLTKVFKSIKLSGQKTFRLRFKKEDNITTDEITFEIKNKLGLSHEDIAAEVESKFTYNLFLYENAIPKVENKITLIKLKDVEIKVISTKWKNFTPQDKRKPPLYSFTMRGFVGSDTDLKVIMKTFGIATKIKRDKNPNGTFNGRVFAEFSKLNNLSYLHLDYIELEDNSNIFIQWYNEGKRVVGFSEQNYRKNIQTINNSNSLEQDTSKDKENLGEIIMKEVINDIINKEKNDSNEHAKNDQGTNNTNLSSDSSSDEMTTKENETNPKKKSKKSHKYNSKLLPKNSQSKKRKKEDPSPNKSKKKTLINTPEDIILSSQEDATSTPLKAK